MVEHRDGDSDRSDAMTDLASSSSPNDSMLDFSTADEGLNLKKRASSSAGGSAEDAALIFQLRAELRAANEALVLERASSVTLVDQLRQKDEALWRLATGAQAAVPGLAMPAPAGPTRRRPRRRHRGWGIGHGLLKCLHSICASRAHSY